MRTPTSRTVRTGKSDHGRDPQGSRIDTTTKLRRVIEDTLDFLPEKEKKDTIKKTCQRTFQALRIDVNQEFEVLYEFMEKLPGALRPGGRVAILTFTRRGQACVSRRSKRDIRVGFTATMRRTSSVRRRRSALQTEGRVPPKCAGQSRHKKKDIIGAKNPVLSFFGTQKVQVPYRRKLYCNCNRK